ncbi:acyl-CoA thioesterase/bile acid-CoA:amino acid N-acyltransferase family protein [Paenalcaligenes sp. Me131]|uniref:acyl-CoA thioesterase/bile acid-CoA:amino acid N-acyltransferase family protein n=1 Tax=Paenalcaligenes sp. Me131 TaxID=3392636 RepID=UPI003D273D54
MLNLVVTPVDAGIDVPRQISVRGAVPGEKVAISASTVRQGVRWTSYAEFVADDRGCVELAKQVPDSEDSTYDVADAMGLIWSQLPQVDTAREVFNQSVFDPLVTTIGVRSGVNDVSTTLIQRVATAGVTRIEVEEDGVYGVLFLPERAASCPAIMVLGGSEGGVQEHQAALYASHGYAALALGYFRVPGRSDYISHTDLEYFQQALAWLRMRVQPLNDFVAISGFSRGAELALLLAATYPQAVSAVIAFAPSAFVHSSQSAADPDEGREAPAWFVQGEPLCHLWQNNRHASWEAFDSSVPHRHELAIQTALQDIAAMDAARIPVEHIQGPVLLLSGTDDGVWPASRFCQMVVDRLAARAEPALVQWINTPHAGHAIRFPYVPTSQSTYLHPISRLLCTTGGQPYADAWAGRESWSAVLAFLRTVSR